MAALNEKVCQLQRQNEIFAEKLASLEQSKLSTSLQNAVDRIVALESKLKLCIEQLQGSGDDCQEVKLEKKHDKSAIQKHNRGLLQRASIDQVSSCHNQHGCCHLQLQYLLYFSALF